MGAKTMTTGSEGSAVANVQRHLGMAKPDGKFGPQTKTAVKAFQKSKGLNPDGIVGPLTLAALAASDEPEAPPVEVEAVPIEPGDLLARFLSEFVRVAKAEIGTREVGKNRGTEVVAYLKSVGLDAGNPWCAAFLYWCAAVAAASVGCVNPVIKTGGTQFALAAYRRLGWIVPANSGRAGDIFIMTHSPNSGHIGILENSLVGGSYATIEGNTSRHGSREGDGVYQSSRRPSEFSALVRIPAVVPVKATTPKGVSA